MRDAGPARDSHPHNPERGDRLAFQAANVMNAIVTE